MQSEVRRKACLCKAGGCAGSCAGTVQDMDRVGLDLEPTAGGRADAGKVGWGTGWALGLARLSWFNAGRGGAKPGKRDGYVNTDGPPDLGEATTSEITLVRTMESTAVRRTSHRHSSLSFCAQVSGCRGAHKSTPERCCLQVIAWLC